MQDASLWNTPCAGPCWALLGDAAGYVHPIVASAVSITRGDIAYVAVIVWAFVGIAFKPSNTPIVTIAAWAAAVFVALTLFIGVPHTQGRLRELETSPPSTEVRDRW